MWFIGSHNCAMGHELPPLADQQPLASISMLSIFGTYQLSGMNITYCSGRNDHNFMVSGQDPKASNQNIQIPH